MCPQYNQLFTEFDTRQVSNYEGKLVCLDPVKVMILIELTSHFSKKSFNEESWPINLELLVLTGCSLWEGLRILSIKPKFEDGLLIDCFVT